MNSAPALPGASDGLLADAFSVFISAAARLELSYAQLHDEVSLLRAQLEERNRALASSLEENARMKIVHSQILDALPCGVAVVDPRNEEIVLLNPEAARLLGMPSSEKPMWARLPSALRAMIASGPSQTWRLGDEQQILVHAAWGECWLRVRCTSIDNTRREADQAAPPTLVLTIRDTTFQKHADEEREASRQMMALAEMATLLAHEIRNPLGSMELFASLLASEGELTGQAREWTGHLQAGVRSLSATVNNVLRFHTPGSAQLVATNLRELLVSGIEFIRPLAHQSGVKLSFEETLGEHQVMAEAGALQQLLLNLAHNAFRHTPAGGTFGVRARVESRGETRLAVLELSDTGSGISPENLPHIFEAGFSTNCQGTGIGLAVCQRIVAQHRGTISTTSELGEGTTFRVELPIL